MKQYKIEIYTKPIFDDQYKYRVFEVKGSSEASNYNYKEEWVCSGNDTLENVKKELEYYLKKSI